jgi:CheY-like chemotaxis protein
MKRQGATILVVDDDPDDRMLIERAFRKNGVRDTIHLLSDGDEAIAYLNGEEPYSDRSKFAFPSFVITDLKMKRVNGFQLIRHLKGNIEWAVIPTIVLSGSGDTHDIKQSYFFGANSFFMKPMSPDDLSALLKRLYDYWVCVEVPQTDLTGKMLPTASSGKLSEDD